MMRIEQGRITMNKDEEYRLKELPWNQQLKEVIKAYHKGLITYVEYILKQHEIINQALMSGVSYETLNEFQA
jgi:hypothetical protein